MAAMGFTIQVVVLAVIILISKSTTHFKCSKCLGYLTYRLKSEHFLCSFFTSITNLTTTETITINPTNVSDAEAMNFTLLGDKFVK